MNERFLITLGKQLSRNEENIKLIAKCVSACDKRISLLILVASGMIIGNIARDKKIARLQKQVIDLKTEVNKKAAGEEVEDFDFLK